jgi:hypothetical protein
MRVCEQNSVVWRNTSSVHNYLETYLRRAASANKNIREEVPTKALSFMRTWLRTSRVR